MNKEELVSRHRELKAESSRLKLELGRMGKRKSVLFAERDGIKKNFREVIAKLKELKAERDRHTGIVKELKNKRNSASSRIKSLVTGLRNLRDQKDKTKRKLGVRSSSESLSAEISRLEYQIETAALPFREREEDHEGNQGKKSGARQGREALGHHKKPQELLNRISQQQENIRGSPQGASGSRHRQPEIPQRNA